MDEFINDFLKAFAWYRSLSLRLLDEIQDDMLSTQISERSLPVREQFIDLGIMQIKILEMLSNKPFADQVNQPSTTDATKEQIKTYLLECDKIFKENIVKLNWFGRMDFSFKEALFFSLSHEAMHHGEVLSWIFAKNIDMPQAFKETWGFEL
jgi:hypothetical protein